MSGIIETVNPNRMVVNAARVNAELNKTYEPRQVKLGSFQTSASCQLVLPAPTAKPWPSNCDEVNGTAIRASNDGGAWFMLLNGKRLGNLSAIEAIPNQAILGFRNSQRAALGETIAGEIVWNAGSRDGVDGKVQRYAAPRASPIATSADSDGSAIASRSRTRWPTPRSSK